MRLPRPPYSILVCALVTTWMLSSCALDSSSPRLSPQGPAATILDPTDPAQLASLLDDLTGRRVIYLGEIHDRYGHHVNQLEIIRGLQGRGMDLAIGMEAFEEPFQRYLDDYAAGRIGEREMLRKTEYYQRWRYDYRLYRDVVRFARAHRIPLLALNAPSELIEAVSDKGIAGLTAAQRSRLPPHIEPADTAYEKRLREAFAAHGRQMTDEDRFRRFLEVQSVWDEHMARRAADYLSRHPEKMLVVLVGSAHVLHDSAIPKRLRRYLAADDAVIVTLPYRPLPGVEPDQILAARDTELSPRGQTGMTLSEGRGHVTVQRVEPQGSAQEAGILAGDRILRVAGERIRGLADLQLSMTDSAPGDRLRLQIRRGPKGAARTLRRTLILQ